MLGWKLIHFSKRGHWNSFIFEKSNYIIHMSWLHYSLNVPEVLWDSFAAKLDWILIFIWIKYKVMRKDVTYISLRSRSNYTGFGSPIVEKYCLWIIRWEIAWEWLCLYSHLSFLSHRRKIIQQLGRTKPLRWVWRNGNCLKLSIFERMYVCLYINPIITLKTLASVRDEYNFPGTRGISGFVTACLWVIWGRGLTTCSLYICLYFW